MEVEETLEAVVVLEVVEVTTAVDTGASVEVV